MIAVGASAADTASVAPDVDPADLTSLLIKHEGDYVEQGEVIALGFSSQPLDLLRNVFRRPDEDHVVAVLEIENIHRRVAVGQFFVRKDRLAHLDRISTLPSRIYSALCPGSDE